MIRCYFKHAVEVLAVFVLFYHSGNLINQYRSSYVPVHWQWELHIPLLPAFIVPYLSVYLLVLLPLWRLPCRAQQVLRNQMIFCILISAFFFLVIPSKIAYRPVDEFGPWQSIYSLMYFFDRPHNLFPSLHISLSLLIMANLWNGLNRRWRAVFSLWFGLIVLSVLFTHQHHALDVAGGVALSFFVLWLWKKNSWHSGQNP